MDALVHQRLREHGLVHLVVAVASVGHLGGAEPRGQTFRADWCSTDTSVMKLLYRRHIRRFTRYSTVLYDTRGGRVKLQETFCQMKTKMAPGPPYLQSVLTSGTANAVSRTREKTGDSHQVYDHVFVEGAPPLGRHFAHVHHGLGVVGVDVEDGSVDDAGHVRGVRRGASHPGIRGEADLRGRRMAT